jgi:hypothetical protein
VRIILIKYGEREKDLRKQGLKRKPRNNLIKIINSGILLIMKNNRKIEAEKREKDMKKLIDSLNKLVKKKKR